MARSRDDRLKRAKYQYDHYYSICITLRKGEDNYIISLLSKIPKGKLNEYLRNVVIQDLHSELSFYDDYFNDEDNPRYDLY